ncbi:AAA family ATPase [Kiloniella majae]|uniref:AAA family ATPase n=1 Tax=Kiloniella majae TaxID=1938558 RepID=UPI000A2791CC|nr:AAA family ATPase [Kiloniella majae]
MHFDDNQPIFEFKKAERKNIPALIALWGPSGSGKTFTALQIARGLVGPEGNIGLIDTENRRAEFYSDLVGGWDHLDLQPPFTPARYVQAMQASENSGKHHCVIIDSMSHIWAGEGGVLQMANASNSKGLNKWAGPKTEHMKAVNYLLRSHCHVIICLRAKNLNKQVGKGKDAKIVNMGLTPVCGDNLIYEMTVSALLGSDHKPVFLDQNTPFNVDPMVPTIKAPEGLKDVIVKDEYLGIQTGEAIRSWIDGGVAHSLEDDKLMNATRDLASLGIASLERHWETLNNGQKKVLLPVMPEMKAIATEADKHSQTEDDIPFESENDNPLAHKSETAA